MFKSFETSLTTAVHVLYLHQAAKMGASNTHTHTHTYTHTHTHTHAREHTHTHERTHAHTHARTHTHTYTRKAINFGDPRPPFFLKIR